MPDALRIPSRLRGGEESVEEREKKSCKSVSREIRSVR